MLQHRPTSSSVPGWSFTWQGNNRSLRVRAQITWQTATANTIDQRYLCRRRVGDPGFDLVATGQPF